MKIHSLEFGLVLLCLATSLQAQVDYGKDSPWDQRAESGPDAEVPGWFYNLGITGLRAQLVADEPRALLIKFVFPRSPADGHVKIGDLIVGAGGQKFKADHRNGYGENVFGADGPISEFANELEQCQSAERDGKLALTLRRGKENVEVVLDVGQKYGTYSATFPGHCAKSDKVLAELLTYLVDHQEKDGSFGDPVHNTFAPLALLASGDAKYLPAVELNVRYHFGVTRTRDISLINWSYMSAAIVLSEYYLATGEKWVLPELQRIHDCVVKSQYLHMSQIDPQSKKSHPDDFPKGPRDSHGGWGHNPGFEGYGPIAMLTGQGALAYSLMHRSGIKVDRKNHEAAYEFLKRGTGQNGYVWYGDKIGGGPDGWADMGRTGAAGIANFLSPYADPAYHERAISHAKVIGKHPRSFPDTHGSPPMGMAYTALAANLDPESFRKLMDANRWWFTMAQCIDGSFYYQPNRDNAGYGSDSRMTASSVVAFILTIPKHSLVITGKEANALKPDDKPVSARNPVKVFILAGQSNMEGQGFIKADPKRNEGKGSLEYLTKVPATADKFKHLLDKKGEWAVRDDVWIHDLDRKGKLTVGYGAREDRIGPELGFGHVVGEAYEEPVLLIKLAWGGKSLAKDFRPPSSGGELGPYYTEVVKRTKAVLGDLKKEFPEFADRGYELAGFGWHQGWNDRVNQAFNDEYEKNMANFIRDIRKDLGVKNLPFVIAETGMSGKEEKHPRALSLMKAQAAVAEYKEFKGNVAFVGTREFWREKDVSPTGQAYHWNTNAETYYLIGEAMGNAMMKLRVVGPRVAPRRAAEARKPNLVYILADDLGYGDVGCYNLASKIPTPNIDRLAKEGMRFTDAHAPASVCTPTRYALLTGRYAWRTRLQRNVIGPFSQPLIEEKQLTVAGLLREEGYATACIGKWHLGWGWPKPVEGGKRDFTKPIPDGPTTRGFDLYFGTDVPNYPPYCFLENDRTVGIPSAVAPVGRDSFNIEGPMIPDWKLVEVLPALEKRAVEYIEKASKNDKPFFLYLPLTSPHYPVVPAAAFKGKSKAGEYGDFVVQTDHVVGEVLDALKKSGVAEKTLVIFTSDNGPEISGEVNPGAYDRLKEFGHASMGTLRGAKRDAWEGGHRVPFIARWPGKIRAGSTCDETICHVDLIATLAALLEVKLPLDAGVDSVNILPALLDDRRYGPPREATVHHSGQGKFAIRHGDWVLIFAPTGDDNRKQGEPTWFRRDRGHAPHTEAGELFNLKADPTQKNNLYTTEPAKVNELTTLMERYVKEGRSTPGPKQQNDVDITWDKRARK